MGSWLNLGAPLASQRPGPNHCSIEWVGSKQKGTKAARKVPDNFDEVRRDFLKRVQKKVTENSLPPSMIVNFDETGMNVVPTSHWTLHSEGSKQVPITGIDDKRQLTMVLANIPTGTLHPVFNFPESWNITHTANHWSNEHTNIEYIEKVLCPTLRNNMIIWDFLMTRQPL